MFLASTPPSGELDYFGDRWTTQTDRSVVPHTASSFTGGSASPSGFEQSRLGSNDPAISLYSIRGSTRFKHSERNHVSQRRHSRHRDEARRGSAGDEGESSASSVRSFPRAQRRKTFSQKAMLSKALQKANQAVLLDNALNFEGAMDAYQDACNLLKQVMSRSSTEDDKRKLDAVVCDADVQPHRLKLKLTIYKQRITYSNRIDELRNTDLSNHSPDRKALPKPPRERDSQDQEAQSPFSDDDASTLTDSSPVVSNDWIPPETSAYRDPSIMAKSNVPPRRQSSLPPTHKFEKKILQASKIAQKQHQMQYQTWINLDTKEHTKKTTLSLEPPLLKHYLPPPLSPRRPLSPVPFVPSAEESTKASTQLSAPPIARKGPSEPHQVEQENAEFTSWLDTIDESGGSSSSSVHSRTSSIGLRRKRIRAASGATEADFDAALDAAVEVAYDDGFEPDDDDDEDDPKPMHNTTYQSDEQIFVSDARKNVEIAKEMVREAEREAAILLANDREKRQLQEKLARRDSIEMDYGDDEEEEEERMLEEMTRDYIMDDSEYDVRSKSALPRQSDSSGFSGRTWGSSICSNPTSAGTSLSTVAESAMLPTLATQLQAKTMPSPAHPPPTGALPPPPNMSATMAPPPAPNGLVSRPPSSMTQANPCVRERRLSGLKPKHLKIETNTRAPNQSESPPSVDKPPIKTPLAAPVQAISESAKPAIHSAESQKANPDLAFSPHSAVALQFMSRKDLPHPSVVGSVDAAPATSSLTRATTAESENSGPSIPSSPGRFATKAVGLRKNFSSSSLRSKSMTASSADVIESSPTTPSTATHRKGSLSTAIPILPTPTGANFFLDKPPTGGMYLFETDIHSPTSPGSPNPSAANAPLPLEPCPELPILRPFWFLRCIYQAIAHPRGAYISTKLFLPRDIWRVRGIRLKGVEEKISQCDLLSAALLKLAKVDTLDADFVLEEMRFLENVMDQVQANLSKKLGNDVGVVGASALFKGPSTVDDAMSNAETLTAKSYSANNKSYYLSSWRKLRSKGTAAPGATSSLITSTSREGSKEAPSMDSLPMTSTSNSRFFKRDLSRVQYAGPNSNYMAALARLCDAVQILGKSNSRLDGFFPLPQLLI